VAVIRRIFVPLIGAVVVAGAIAAAAFALVTALPQPTSGDRIGVRLLQLLHAHGGRGSRITIGGRSLTARCRQLSQRRSLVELSDGNTFVVSGSRIRAWHAPASELAEMSQAPALVRAALADLAGSYQLYASELISQLERGRRVAERVVMVRGRRVYEVALARERPRVVLIVDTRTLRPLEARFDSAALQASAVLEPPQPERGLATC
jgi:hypothetical protein